MEPQAVFCSALLADTSMHGSDREEFEFDLHGSANSMYLASRDTTITTVAHFTWAVMLNPEVLRRAQAELTRSLARTGLEDNVYTGMFILKGSLAFRNIRAMMRDENVCENLAVFVPEQFLESVSPEEEKRCDPKTSYLDPEGHIYFLNRLCPGENLVDLSTLDVSKAVDEHSNVIEPNVDFCNPNFMYADFHNLHAVLVADTGL
ncbi:hypothetical protein D9619_010520 [Psilocybe cf. subviscida]|uniref:Cytochrome P450 n=1 Tax=Psilocybe cf. subviscida TaxID=2480587 RepID=A0A8H5ARV3_9AGAR|nr:hypothetical protein D9619_010520 [Psilocybe cf. subviscida]